MIIGPNITKSTIHKKTFYILKVFLTALVKVKHYKIVYRPVIKTSQRTWRCGHFKQVLHFVRNSCLTESQLSRK